MANAFDAPARQAFVVDLVDRRDLTNAIALNSTMFNAAAVIGPALAGVVYALYGPVWCFTINGLSYIAVIVALLLMKLADGRQAEPHVNGVAAQGGGALSWLARADPYTDPQHGRDQSVWHEPDDAVAGLVGGCAGRRRAHQRAVAVGAWPGGAERRADGGGARPPAGAGQAVDDRQLCVAPFDGFPGVRWLPLALVLLIPIGWGFMVEANTSNALIQTNVPDELRGRVMSLFTLTFFGGMPLGALLAGFMAVTVGEPATLFINATMVLLASTLIWFRLPYIRKLR